MSKLLTPKQVAQAIQVSESSVKRWCDAGVITTEYTAGGHRRITTADLVAFVRSTNHRLVEPAVIDLSVSGEYQRIDEQLVERFTTSLLDGGESVTRQMLTELYLAGHSVAAICDELVAPAFRAVGELWHSGEAEIFQERFACTLCHRAMNQLATLIQRPAEDAPLAIGGTPGDDAYSIATTMVEFVLRDNGWQAHSLGSNLPFDSLRRAIEQHRPKLFWLSVSHLADEREFLHRFRTFQQAVGDAAALVVGGIAMTPELREQITYSAYCDNMQHLESFANTLVKL